MKVYAVYDMKYFEQCVAIGTMKEISEYLGNNTDSIRSYMSHKKAGRRDNLIQKRYDVVQVIEDEEELQAETINIKSDKEIFKELIDTFAPKNPQFEIFDKFKWELKGMKDKNIIDEEWKSIEGFNYSISNYGRIRNDKTKKLKNPRYHRWILQVDIYENAKRYTCDVTRLVAHYFIKEISKNERVRHKDGDIRNNYYKNLEIISK